MDLTGIRSPCWLGWSFLETLKENPPYCSSQLLEPPRIPWLWAPSGFKASCSASSLPYIVLLPSQNQWIANVKPVCTMKPPLLCNITHSQALASFVCVCMLSRAPVSVAP